MWRWWDTSTLNVVIDLFDLFALRSVGTQKPSFHLPCTLCGFTPFCPRTLMVRKLRLGGQEGARNKGARAGNGRSRVMWGHKGCKDTRVQGVQGHKGAAGARAQGWEPPTLAPLYPFTCLPWCPSHPSLLRTRRTQRVTWMKISLPDIWSMNWDQFYDFSVLPMSPRHSGRISVSYTRNNGFKYHFLLSFLRIFFRLYGI